MTTSQFLPHHETHVVAVELVLRTRGAQGDDQIGWGSMHRTCVPWVASDEAPPEESPPSEDLLLVLGFGFGFADDLRLLKGLAELFLRLFHFYTRREHSGHDRVGVVDDGRPSRSRQCAHR